MIFENIMENRSYSDYDDYIKNFHLNIPENFNFAFDVVDRQAELVPDKIAIEWTNDFGECRSVTFLGIKEKSDEYARKFIRLGVKKNDNVIVKLGRSLEWFFVIIALMKIGAVGCPCPDMVSEKELKYRIDMLSPKFIFTKKSIEMFEELDDNKGIRLTNKFVNGDTMLIYFTSGSTGKPKMICQHNLLPISALPINKYASEYTPETICMNVAEFGWIMHLESFWALFWFGCQLVVYDYSGHMRGRRIKQVINKYNVDNILAATPVFYMLLLEGAEGISIRVSRCGGSVLHKDLFERWEKATGMRIKNFYGQTEFPHSFGNFSFCECRATSVGKLLAGITKTDDEEFCVELGDKRPLPLSSNDFGSVYKSGDILKYDEDGYCYFHTRTGDMINFSGYRFTANEIEEVLMELPFIKECLVYGVPDEIRDELVKAEIVLMEGVEKSKETSEKIKSYLKANLSAYKCPKFIEFVDELEKTASGKIKRKNKIQIE